jgi:hypothetical protein
MFKFKWRFPNGLLVAKLNIEHQIDAMFIANALVHTYADSHEADELPHNLTANTVAVMVREKLRRQGDSWNECGAWDQVDQRDMQAFQDWASATVRRCFPKAAASDHTFQLHYPAPNAS